VLFLKLAPKYGVYVTKMYTVYMQKERIAGPKTTMLLGNLLDIFLSLGLLLLKRKATKLDQN
jgi:hypothetical protein